MFLPEELGSALKEVEAVAAVEVLEAVKEVEAAPGLKTKGDEIPTKGVAIGPIRPIGAAARIAGAVGPGIDGPAVEAAAVADADDGRRQQMGEGELKMRLSSNGEMSLARMLDTQRVQSVAGGGCGGGLGPAMRFGGAAVKSGGANGVGQ